MRPPKSSFLDTIHLLFVLGKFFGLSCYGVSKGRLKYKVSFDTSHFIRFFAFVVVFLILSYLNFKLELNSDENNTRIFNQTQQIQMILSLLCVVVGYCQALLMRERFWHIANTIQEIDHQIEQLLKIEIDHNHLHRFTIMRLLVCYSSLLVVYTVFGYYCLVINRSAGTMVQYLTYVIINVTYTLLAIQFQVFMHSMYIRFSILNTFVESSILPQTHVEMSTSTSVELQTKLLFIAKIIDQLNNLVPLLSLYFSTFFVTAALGVFFLTVFNLHSLFRAISQKHSFQFYLLVSIYQMVGLLFNCLFILNIEIASRNTSEAKRMGVLVHKVIANTDNQQLISKLKMLSMQVLHRTPIVSFGLFSLNWQLLFSYVASVASYLFILIQFVMYVDEKSTVLLIQNQQFK